MTRKMRHASREGMDRLQHAAKTLYSGVGSKYALELREMLESDGLRGVAQATPPSPSAYTDPVAFAKDYCAFQFVRKVELDSDKVALEQKAFDDFMVIEARNKLTNQRIGTGLSKDVEGVLLNARRKIRSILGPFDWREFATGFGWGPGSTSSIKALDATVDVKINEPRMSVTPRAAKFLAAYIGASPLWCRSRGLKVDAICTLMPGEFQLTDCTTLSTAAKGINNRRIIEPQPTGNMPLQKCVGAMIRGRLKRVGIDLNSQSANQLLASVAQAFGLATVDLKDASNTVVFRLVEAVVDEEWFDVLNHLRVPYTNVGEILRHKLELFSPMGNGFTFELESLIFYGLLWAIIRDEANDPDTPIAVYGDDIVVATEHYQRLREVFTECGFTVNDEKSFHEGPFYESCGKHYHSGVDVTPVFQKKILGDRPNLIRCANRLVRWAHRVGSGGYYDTAALGTYLYLCEELTLLHDLAEVGREAVCKSFGRVFKYRPCPRQPFTVEGDLAVIDTSWPELLGSHPRRVSISGLSFEPARREADADALLVEVLREKTENRFHPDGSYILPRPYGVGAYREMLKLDPSFSFIRAARVPTLGKVTPRDMGRYTWTTTAIWVIPSDNVWEDSV